MVAILASEKKGVECAATISAEATSLIRDILKVDPKNRPSFDHIINHPWMKKFEKEFGIDLASYR